MKKIVFALMSIIICFIVLIAIAKFNYDLAVRYKTTDGKGRALFGILELCSFYYKVYFFAGGVLSVVLASISIRRKENILASYIALGFGLLSASLVFIPFWKFMV